jgi:hypothetical protein
MKIGNVLNFKWYDGLFGKAIRYYNRLVYKEDGFTHTAIVIDIKPGFYTVAEALGNGFTISDYEDWWVEGKIKEGYIFVGEPKKDLVAVKALAKKYEKIRYGYLWLPLIFLFGEKSSWVTDGTKSLICSEAVARLLYDASDRQLDLSKEFKKSYDVITPQDIFKSRQIKWK